MCKKKGVLHEVRVRGQNYRIGDVVVIKDKQPKAVFGLIMAISCEGLFTIDQLKIVDYDRHRNAYIVEKLGPLREESCEAFVDPMPLGIYHGRIVLRHFIDELD